MAHPLGVRLVHREPLAAPIARTTQPLQLIDDNVAVLVLKVPDALKEFLAPQIPAAHAFRFAHLALHPRLRRDSRVVRTRQPQHLLAILTSPPRQDILQRIVQNVAQMQNPRHIRRRNHNRVAILHRRRVGFKTFSVDPSGIPFGFDGLGFIGFR